MFTLWRVGSGYATAIFVGQEWAEWALLHGVPGSTLCDHSRMQLKRQTTRSELIDQGITLLESRYVDELTLRRFDIEAQKLIAVDAAGAWFCKAVSAFIRRDIDEMDRCLQNALRLESIGEQGANSVVIYSWSGMYERARELSQSLLARYPGTPSVLDVALMAAHRSFDFTAVADLLGRFEAIKQDPLSTTTNIDRARLVEFGARIDAAGIRSQLCERAEFCVRFARDTWGVMARSWVATLSDVELGMACALHIERDDLDSASLSIQLVDAILDRYDDPLSDWATFSCIATTDSELGLND